MAASCRIAFEAERPAEPLLVIPGKAKGPADLLRAGSQGTGEPAQRRRRGGRRKVLHSSVVHRDPRLAKMIRSVDTLGPQTRLPAQSLPCAQQFASYCSACSARIVTL